MSNSSPSRGDTLGATASGRVVSRLSWAKAVLFVLISCNAIIFGFVGTTSEAIDSAAWLTLLLLFEIESSYAHRLAHSPIRLVIRAVRLAAGAAVLAAAIGYIYGQDILDTFNGWLWIGVVALLEVEMRWSPRTTLMQMLCRILGSMLYGTLALLVLAWAMRGAWFAAYDALLWLVAFAQLELGVMRQSVNRFKK